MFVQAYGQFLAQRPEIIADCEEAIEELNDVTALIRSIQAENDKLEQNTELIRSVVREHASIAQTDEEYHKKYDPLMAEHERITARLDQLLKDRAAKVERGKRLQAFLASLREAPETSTAWDENIWRMLVDHCTVYPDGNIRFTFKNGTEITVQQ